MVTCSGGVGCRWEFWVGLGKIGEAFGIIRYFGVFIKINEDMGWGGQKVQN